ncbi:MAG TPA: branched-chain amino acid transaminase [Candidatus Dormibacteraeota bacterium]|jgi:branched-chain amino acid aminotransferase|nr:branched-chain amino acid transaminase [Candidatus Dormibacteraeota bacterium]
MAIEAEQQHGYAPPSQAESWVYFDGEFKQYKDVHLGLMTHALHYGTGCFEGIRGYWSETQRQMFLVLVEPHFKRLHNSAKILRIDLKYSVQEMIDATLEILRRNRFQEDVYVRPLAFKSAEEIGVRLHNLKDSFAIYTAPFGAYVDVDNGIRCMVSSWRRVDDNAAPARAKITGIYVNSALAKTDAMDNGFDEAIVLTHDGHVSEGSAENLFIVRDDVLITPPESDNILEGVTRKVLMQLAREDLGLTVVERSLDRSELYVADEVFLCGTGAQVAPVLEIDRRVIGEGIAGPVTKSLQTLYFDICKGRVEEKLDWLTPVY